MSFTSGDDENGDDFPTTMSDDLAVTRVALQALLLMPTDVDRRKLFAWFCAGCGAYLGPDTGGACPTCDQPANGAGDFSIGGSLWPGLSKLIEECGEVLQAAGKLIGSRGVIEHWDGTNLRAVLQDEMADVLAAISFVVQKNSFDTAAMTARMTAKLARFNKWHERSDGNAVEQQRCVTCNGLVDMDDGCLRCAKEKPNG